MKVHLTSRESGEFIQNYISTGFDSKLLAFLNNTFTTDEGITPDTKSYSRNTQFMTIQDGLLSDTDEVVSEEYREINYIDFLTYCRDQYVNTNNEMHFAGGAKLSRLAAQDRNGVYRHVSTGATVGALAHAIGFLNDPTRTRIEDWDSIFGSTRS